jgi:hypothetical protein
LETSAKDREMIAATDLRTFAAMKWPNLNHKGRLRELAKLLCTWTARRVRAVYNAEQGVSLRAEEARDIDALTEEARNEYRDLAQLANSLHALLYGPEADFYRPQVDAIRAALVPASGPVSAGGGDAGAGNQGREG